MPNHSVSLRMCHLVKQKSVALLSTVLPAFLLLGSLFTLAHLVQAEEAAVLRHPITKSGAALLQPHAAATESLPDPSPLPLLDNQFNLPTVTGRQQVNDTPTAATMFIQNVGQFEEDVLFRADTNQGVFHFTQDAIWLTVLEPVTQTMIEQGNMGLISGQAETLPEPRRGVNLKLTFTGGNPAPTVVGMVPLATRVSYFRGNNPDEWYTNVPVYAAVRYEEVYPGIDIEFTTEAGQWQPRLMADVTADLSTVQLEVEGAESQTLTEGAQLRLETAIGQIELPLLSVEEQKRTTLPKPELRGQVLVYPFVSDNFEFQAASSLNGIVFSTYIGGNNYDYGNDIAVDANGSVYIVAGTQSSNLITTPGSFDPTYNGGYYGDAYVAKLDTNGTLVYATYLGGSDDDFGEGIVVDGDGYIYVTGFTASTDFPVTSSAYDQTHNGNDDVYVTKLYPDGSGLEYSTFVGGSGGDQARAIAVDSTGNVYVTGNAGCGFPVTAGAFDTICDADSLDAFLFKLNNTGSDLVYATYFGNDNHQTGFSVAVDADGYAYITGETRNNDSIPTTPGAYDTTHNGGVWDAFVAKFNTDGTDLEYSTYLGGWGADCYGDCAIVVDTDGYAYVTGQTTSTNFPTTSGAYQTTYNGGGDDAYVVKFNPEGSDLEYATFLGGDGYDSGHSITVDDLGQAYVTGNTTSSNFPTTLGSIFSSPVGQFDAFVAVLSEDGTGLAYATYLGGSEFDLGAGIGVHDDNVYITGLTASSDFPTKNAVSDAFAGGFGDIFVTKLGSVGLPLYPGQDWNVECPFCSVADTQSYVNEVNPRSGNFVHSESFLNIPVAGNTLSFDLTYISAATNTYTTTIGYGWAHNYEMQLHIDDHTNLTHTVTMQAPGGSRFPFYGRGSSDPGYNKYAGVTADLERIEGATLEDRQYVVTAYNQYKATFRYDGRLIKYETPDGNAISLSYADFNGQEQLYRASQGTRYLEYDYLNGRLHTVTDSANRTVILSYQGNDLSTITDPTQATTTFLYQNHLLTDIIDGSNRTIKKIFYDSNQRAYRVEDGLGNAITEITFDNPVNLLTVNEDSLAATAVVTAAGTVMTYTYDTRGTLVNVRHACNDGTNGCQAGPNIQYDYNFKGNRLQDANGNPATTIRWNPGGSNPEYVKDALENETLLHYDSFNNLTLTIDARLNPTTYTYRYTDPDDPNNPYLPTFLTGMTDTSGNTYVYTPTIAGLTGPVDGLLYEEKDPNGVLTRYGYNDFGQLIQAVRGAGTSDAITTTYGYDAAGHLITSTQLSALESITSLNAYDASDRLLATIENWTGSSYGNWESDCIIPAPEPDENICTRYDYDDAGRPISTTNALGQTSLTFYDAAGRVVTSVVNYDGVTPFTALCTDFTNPDPEYNICSLTGYDEFGRVVITTNSLGYQTVTDYDSLGRVSRTIVNWEDGNPAESDRDLITEYEYDAVGNVLVITDPLGRKTRTFYDELNRVEGTIDNWDGLADLAACATLPREREENICTQYQYDEVGNTIFVTNTLTQTTRTFYDPLNRAKASVENWQPGFDDPNQCHNVPDNTDDENICTLYGYDDAGNQITTTNALNQTTFTVYDRANRPFLTVQNWDGTPINEAADCQFPPALPDVNVCTLTTYDALGRQVSIQDPNGHLTLFAYDGLGRVVMTTQYLDGLPITSQTGYDALGNRLSVTDAEGHTTTYIYDTLNRLVQTTSAAGVINIQAYNTAGWVITSTNGLGYSTIMGYDHLGRRTSITDAEGNTTMTEYDALGNQTATVDAEGVRTAYYFDGLNRLVRVIENQIFVVGPPTTPTNISTYYRYDALGNRLVITNARGFTNSYTIYDDLNRPIIVRDALGNETTTAYDALGNQVVITDANDAPTFYAYDRLNRLTTIGYLADGELVSYELDAVGNRLAMLHNLGTTIYQYDDLYRLITVTNPFTGVVGYRYDRVGNRTQLIYPDTRSVAYTYDMDNRLIQVDDWDEGITGYEYDPAGRLITTTLPNGVQTANSYDAANRLIRLTHTDSSDNLLSSYEYELDGLGNRVVATETLRLPSPGPSLESASLSLPASLPEASTENSPTLLPSSVDDNQAELPVQTQTVISDGQSLLVNSLYLQPLAEVSQTASMTGGSNSSLRSTVNGYGVIFHNGAMAATGDWTPLEIAATVPLTASSGDVFVATPRGNSNTAPFTLGNSAVPDPSGQASGPTDKHEGGVINTDTVWDQDILITGDVTVAANATLTITPGVTVFFEANYDDQSGGYWTDKSELHIHGTLIANGTITDPIYFTSYVEQGAPAVGDWGAIVIRRGSLTSSLSNCSIRYAVNGIRMYTYSEAGGNLSVSITNCTITENETGIYMRSGPGYPAGGTQIIAPTIAHNLIENNSSYGLYFLTGTGYGTTRNESVIQDNVIRDNGAGIYLVAGSWWLGHVENNPAIRNNTIISHTGYGIHMEAQGSSDNSGSDTKLLATVENNLLTDNSTNIHLYLDPRGSDGLQILSPVIRYNSILNGSDGIVVDDAQNYDTLNPTISHNHFDGHSSYAIENQTSRTITANDNYWGGDTAAWDAGPQGGDTSGTVTISNYLTSDDPPVFSRLSPGQAEAAESVTLYGVNFGDGLASLQTTVIQYDYDPLYRLTGASYSGAITATYEYVYDTVGNMTAYTETVGTATSSVNRTFNAANQLVTSADTELGTTSFYYDANGNLVQILPPGVNPGEAGEQLYTFNQRNLLTDYQLGAGSSVYDTMAEYVYDGNANRLQQIDHTAGATTTYTNDILGLSQVLVSDDGTTTTYNLFGLDLISQDDGTATRFLLTDGLGSTRLEMVGSAIETTTTYEPYGKLLAQTGETGTVYGFTGEEYDSLTGMAYLRARYYNPGMKLFASRDSFPGWARTSASQHGYSYSHNNPVNFVDPTGHCIDRNTGEVRMNEHPYGTGGLCSTTGAPSPSPTPSPPPLPAPTPPSTPAIIIPTPARTPLTPLGACTPTPTPTATSFSMPQSIWSSFPVRTGSNSQPDWIQWYGYTEYAVTRVYGNALGIHAGLDFGVYYNRFEPFDQEAGTGIPVYAAAFGTIQGDGLDTRGLGRVKISFRDGLVGFYDHLDKDNIPLKSGPVTPDTIIGYLETTQKHLHLELREDVTVRNPLPYFADSPRNVMLNWNLTNLTRYQRDWSWFNPLDQPPTTYTTPTPTP